MNEFKINKIDFEFPKRMITHSERETVVSSKNLLHFTPKYDFLKDILINGFCPKINIEVPIYLKNYYEIENMLNILKINSPQIDNVKIPMVCFSDIVKNAYKTHMKRYGYYGLSISKDWAISNFICPVIYLKESTKTHIIFNNIYGALEQLSLKEDEISSPLLNLITNLTELKEYFKLYSDDHTHFKYYDEREWRYTPRGYFDSNKTDTYLKIDFEKLHSVFVKTSKEKHEIAEIIRERQNNFDIKMIKFSRK